MHIEPSRVPRVDVVIRLAILAALGSLGCSSLYWALYLVLPAVVAMLLSRGADRYLSEDAPALVRALRWLAGAYAYLWLLTEAVPTTEEGGPVELVVDLCGKPSVESALLRLVTSLPALIVFACISIAGVALWSVAALSILIQERVPAGVARLLAMGLRYQFRLVAYHLSLVDAYPVLGDALLPLPPRSSEA
jgi:hypothetical protein